MSGYDRIFVHTAIIRNISKFVKKMLSSFSLSDKIVIILPASPPATLQNLVTVMYTGHMQELTQEQSGHVINLGNYLGMKISEGDNIGIEVEDNLEAESTVNDNDKLKIKTKTFNKHGLLALSFPQSRTQRDKSRNKIKEVLHGFPGRVQREYNEHPVGVYMGPYDLNSKLSLNIQLPDSKLTFKEYTTFYHEGNTCFELSLKHYDKYADLEKIDAYRILKIIKTDDNSSEGTEISEDEEDKKVYTCQLGICKIPCPCPQCHMNHPQCLDHRIKHESLFDESSHAISIKSSEEFCVNEEFFKKSCILKFSGIPMDCKKCKNDLLLHHCYHFQYHDRCRFCKPSWYRYKAKSETQLRALEKEERDYFKRVCPICDKQFITASHMKKHIKYEHEGEKFKCDYCNNVYNSQQAKSYHERLKHTPTQSQVHCAMCKRSFGSEVALKSHMKYVHTSQKRLSCKHCEKTFKQIKNLRAHLASIHDIDQTRESYCEKERTTNLKCPDCDSVFSYAKNLKAHRKSKHAGEKKVYECEVCAVKYTEKKSLVRHIKDKHGK